MTWHYVLVKKYTKYGVFYSVGEQYSSGGYVDAPTPAQGETKEELIKDLENMLHDIKTYDPIEIKDEL